MYFQALQLILRLQIKALLHEIPGLPQEIEVRLAKASSVEEKEKVANVDCAMTANL